MVETTSCRDLYHHRWDAAHYKFPKVRLVDEKGASPDSCFSIAQAKYNHWLLIPPGKLTKLWKITVFDGTTHFKWPFSMAILVYQRVWYGIPAFSQDIVATWVSSISFRELKLSFLLRQAAGRSSVAAFFFSTEHDWMIEDWKTRRLRRLRLRRLGLAVWTWWGRVVLAFHWDMECMECMAWRFHMIFLFHLFLKVETC